MRNVALLLGIYLSLDHLSRLCYNGRATDHSTPSRTEVLMKDQIKAGIRPVGTPLLAGVLLAVFVFAGVSYDEKQYLEAIVSTAVISVILLAVQTVNKNTFHPHTWNLWTTFLTIIVGLATHYSALVIGVSFGGVYSQDSSIAWDLTALLVMQTVLTSAAYILVGQFQRSNAARRNPKCCRSKPAGN